MTLYNKLTLFFCIYKVQHVVFVWIPKILEWARLSNYTVTIVSNILEFDSIILIQSLPVKSNTNYIIFVLSPTQDISHWMHARCPDSEPIRLCPYSYVRFAKRRNSKYHVYGFRFDQIWNGTLENALPLHQQDGYALWLEYIKWINGKLILSFMCNVL